MAFWGTFFEEFIGVIHVYSREVDKGYTRILKGLFRYMKGYITAVRNTWDCIISDHIGIMDLETLRQCWKIIEKEG